MNNILPEFQKFIVQRKLAPENQAPFYARWVSRFLRFSNTQQDKPLDLRIQMFLDALKKDEKLQDRQFEQADTAVKLYIHHFLSNNASALSPDAETAAEEKYPDVKTMQEKIREILRTKHYAYSTERTYIDWFLRFHTYLTGVKNKDWQKQGADETDVRDFLSHLAIKQRVSSSTQNQAFNALLFLFREVLKIDLHDLSKTVRAKRGPKLPAVLTQDEVRNLFQQLKEKDRLLVHVLYGTGMRLMDGVNIREVQELLGHKNVETTMIYTHVLRNMAKAPMSPLDTLLADEACGKNR